MRAMVTFLGAEEQNLANHIKIQLMQIQEHNLNSGMVLNYNDSKEL